MVSLVKKPSSTCTVHPPKSTAMYQTSSTLCWSPGEGQTLLRAEDASAFVESDDVAGAAAEEIETDGTIFAV